MRFYFQLCPDGFQPHLSFVLVQPALLWRSFCWVNSGAEQLVKPESCAIRFFLCCPLPLLFAFPDFKSHMCSNTWTILGFNRYVDCLNICGNVAIRLYLPLDCIIQDHVIGDRRHLSWAPCVKLAGCCITGFLHHLMPGGFPSHLTSARTCWLPQPSHTISCLVAPSVTSYQLVHIGCLQPPPFSYPFLSIPCFMALRFGNRSLLQLCPFSEKKKSHQPMKPILLLMEHGVLHLINGRVTRSPIQYTLSSEYLDAFLRGTPWSCQHLGRS